MRNHTSVVRLGAAFVKRHHCAYKDNERNILSLLEPDPDAVLLDLGCADGNWTMVVARQIGAARICGVELQLSHSIASAAHGIDVVIADLNHSLPLSDESFDVIHSNQVIEHLVNVDTFVSEMHRVLGKSGYAIISTENLSSFDNIISLVLGQQGFSQHISRRFHIGNIFSPHFGEEIGKDEMTHKTVFTFFGLSQLLEAHGLFVEKALGAGYFPFPNGLARIDPVHARLIAVKVRKRV